MQVLALWVTRTKWTLLIIFLLWGTHLASAAYIHVPCGCH